MQTSQPGHDDRGYHGRRQRLDDALPPFPSPTSRRITARRQACADRVFCTLSTVSASRRWITRQLLRTSQRSHGPLDWLVLSRVVTSRIGSKAYSWFDHHKQASEEKSDEPSDVLSLHPTQYAMSISSMLYSAAHDVPLSSFRRLRH